MARAGQASAVSVYDELLHCAIDLHVHVDVELSLSAVRKREPEWLWLPKAEALGMRGVVLKSHWWPTAPAVHSADALALWLMNVSRVAPPGRLREIDLNKPDFRKSLRTSRPEWGVHLEALATVIQKVERRRNPAQHAAAVNVLFGVLGRTRRSRRTRSRAPRRLPR
jgi:hypothetical protein